MPNWCQNILTISGPVEDVDRFMETAKSPVDNTDLSFGMLMPIPDEQQDNWYNWCITNWGTKWDVDAVITDETITASDNIPYGTRKSVTYRFSSAWSPPIELFSTLLNGEHPDYENLYVRLTYAESGMGFVGVAEGDVETGFGDWCDDCHDWKDWAYRAESLGFEGEIESYREYMREHGDPETVY